MGGSTLVSKLQFFANSGRLEFIVILSRLHAFSGSQCQLLHKAKALLNLRAMDVYMPRPQVNRANLRWRPSRGRCSSPPNFLQKKKNRSQGSVSILYSRAEIFWSKLWSETLSINPLSAMALRYN